MLDSAGRLQLPKPYREALGIRHRVRMEMTDDGLLIRPLSAAELGQAVAAVDPAQAKELPGRGAPPWSRWLERFRKRT